MTIVETERLRIREISDDDVVDLSKVLSDPKVMQYSTVGVRTERQILEYIHNCQNQYDLLGFGHWIMFDIINNKFVGVCGLNLHTVDAREIVHINYRLAANQQGKGYATEAVLGVLDFAKESLKLKQLYAIIEPENRASVKVIKRAGFNFIKSSEFRGCSIDVFQIDF